MVAFEFLGALLLSYFSIVGAFVSLRWGTVVIALLWQKRGEYDAEARAEFERIVRS